MTFTEMAHVTSFLKNNRVSLRKIEVKDSTPVQIQLLTSSEGKLNRFLSDFKPFKGFKGFNLNLSCLSRKVIRHGKGAAMVKRGTKTRKLTSLIQDYGYSVSVKIRLGLNQYEKDNKLYLNNLGGVDPDFFVVHAKHAGQGSMESEDDTVYPECVEAARGIPVIANGGINTSEKVQSLKEMGVSGVMMGRSAIKNPAIFDIFKNEMGFNDPLRSIPNVTSLRQEYETLFDSMRGDEKYMRRFLKAVGRKTVIY